MIFVIQKICVMKLKDRRYKLYENHDIHNLNKNQYDVCNISYVGYIWKKKTIYRDMTHILNIQNECYLIYRY